MAWSSAPLRRGFGTRCGTPDFGRSPHAGYSSGPPDLALRAHRSPPHPAPPPGAPREAAHAGHVLLPRFVLLEERPDREILIGLEGRFWTADRRSPPHRRARFREALASGLARVAWDFRASPSRTAACGSPPRRGCAARTRPRAGGSARYWLLVRPAAASSGRPCSARSAARRVAGAHIGSRERVRRSLWPRARL